MPKKKIQDRKSQAESDPSLTGQAPDPAAQPQLIKVPAIPSDLASKSQLTPEELITFESLYQPLKSFLPLDYQEVVQENLLFIWRQAQLLDQPVWSEQIQKIQRELTARTKQVKVLRENWPKSDFKDLQAVGYKVDSRGPDDLVYKQSPLLQEILPRGILFVNQQLTIFAPPKFYGFRKGDDDDNQWNTPVHPAATSFLLTNKANGENAQIYWYAPSQAWIIGSKNRKIIARSAEDLAKYRESMYQYSVNIGRVWFAHLSQLETDQPMALQYLKNFLAQTRLTLICELENTQTQHVVPLFKDQLVLVTMTHIYLPKGAHPALTYALAKLLKLPSVVDDLTTYSMDELETICQETSTLWESEGRVMYLLNERRHPVQLLKMKSYWYVMLRAIREKLRSHHRSGNVTYCQTQIQNRLKKMRKEMGIPEEYLQPFSRWGQLFAKWFFTHFNQEQRQTRIGQDYPILWREFLTAYGLPLDQSLLMITEIPKTPVTPFVQKKKTEPVEKKEQRAEPALLVFFQGLPGLGKNFLGDQLLKVFPKSLVVAQDDFIAHHGMKKAGEACLKFLDQAIYSGEYEIIFLARNNASRKQYQKYLKFPKYLFLAPQELTDRTHELVWTCMASVLQRKQDQQIKHPTDDMSATALATLPLKFLKELSYHPMAYRVRFLHPDFLLDKIQRALIEQEIQRFRKASNPWQVADVSEELLTKLNLTPLATEQMLASRRPLPDLVSEVTQIIQQAQTNPPPKSGQYLAVLLDSNEPLNPLLKQFPMGKKVAHHVTLMHVNNFRDDPARWFETREKINTQVQIEVISYKHVPGRLLVGRVHLFTGDELGSKDSLTCVNDWVYTKVPHVTLKLEGKTPAVESVKVLKEERYPETLLTEPIWLTGQVQLLDS